MARCNCPRCPKCKEGRCDCDCKPASAPPAAALQALRRIVAVMGPTAPPCCEGCEWEWTEGLRIANEALAASAQVREVEPATCRPNCPRAKARAEQFQTMPSDTCDCEPAAEPAPVAQGAERRSFGWHDSPHWQNPQPEAQEEIAQIVRDLRDVSRTDGWVCASAAAILIEQQQATIADHARIVAELESEAARLHAEWNIEHSERSAAEASLAACRADAERYRWLRDPMQPLRDALCADDYCGSGLDAAIDALRQEAPHAE